MKSDKERNVQACLSEIGVEINQKNNNLLNCIIVKKLK